MTKFLIALIVFSLIVIAMTLWQGDQYRDFMKSAQKVSGRLVDKQERIADPKTRRREYWVTYHYEVKGASYTTQERLEYMDIWDKLKISYPVDVYYNPEQPGQSYLAIALDRRLGLVNK